jgi:hypothetical protein
MDNNYPPTSDRLKLTVDFSEPTATGWRCFCISPLDLDNHIVREVSEESLLELLHARNGLIPEPITCDDAAGEPVTSVQWMTLPEWISLVGTRRLDFHLGEIINQSEGRTERGSIPEVSPADSLSDRIQFLESTLSQSKHAA